MPKKQKPPVPTQLQPWIDARRKFGLSNAHVQMARELGLNPKKLGKLDNCDQELWKLPLPDFIVQLYRKRYGKDRPDTVRSIAAKRAKKLARKAGKTQMVATSASAYQRRLLKDQLPRFLAPSASSVCSRPSVSRDGGDWFLMSGYCLLPVPIPARTLPRGTAFPDCRRGENTVYGIADIAMH